MQGSLSNVETALKLLRRIYNYTQLQGKSLRLLTVWKVTGPSCQLRALKVNRCCLSLWPSKPFDWGTVMRKGAGGRQPMAPNTGTSAPEALPVKTM